MDEYVTALRGGGVLACPTETQIGLLADARNPLAVQRVCEMKRRPEGEAIPLIVPSFAVCEELATDLSELALELAARFWPGPLTLVIETRAALPAAVVKHGKIAVRVPGPSPALELVRAFGDVLTSTSANLSGSAPLADAEALRATFSTHLAAIVPGSAPGGLPSTIVDVSGPRPKLLRQGALVLNEWLRG